MKPTITLTDSERGWAGELLTKLKMEHEETLQMLEDAVRTGESKSDNPNIAEAKRVLGYLKPLRAKIETGKGALELTAVEAGQLDKLLRDAEISRDYWKTECGEELEEARYKEFDDILQILKPLSRRLDEAKLEWPKQYED
jgi:hypothetical protein